MRRSEDSRFTRALGSELREHRKDRGLTQDQLAELTRMSKSMISKIETGHPSGHNVVYLWHLSRGLRIPLADLIYLTVRRLARQDSTRSGLAARRRLATRRR